jgi:hypothetical protein
MSVVALPRAMSSASEWRLLQRAPAVLRVAAGYTVAAAARLAGVDGVSVSGWRPSYWAARNPQELTAAPRAGRPRLAPALTAPRRAPLLARAPPQEGYPATSWTVPVLVRHWRQHEQCSLSEDTLGRPLPRLSIAGSLRALFFLRVMRRWRRKGAEERALVRRLKPREPGDLLRLVDAGRRRWFPP